jgi:hypothetical protein
MAQRRRRQTRIGPFTHIHREAGAWSVHVTRKAHTFTGHFADAVWGGRGRALLAAQRFRDELLMRIGPDTRVRRRLPRGLPNKTGMVGVSLERYKVEGRVYERYVALWRDLDRRTRRRRFLVQRYGREEARTLAVEARKAGVAEREAYERSKQREQAARRLQEAAPLPRPVKDPRNRKGISMARRRRRRAGGRRATTVGNTSRRNASRASTTDRRGSEGLSRSPRRIRLGLGETERT